MYRAFNYGYYNLLLGNQTEADKGRIEALELVQTMDDRDDILKAMHIRETDEYSLLYLQKFKSEIHHKLQI